MASRARTSALGLTEAQDRFVAIWGQMGGTWGVSRTMAEIHALLYITAQPLCTDDVMERLSISRGNASMSLRALVDWGIVTRAHKRGDRKEYFQAEGDPWAMLRAIMQERIKREVHPALAGLGELRDLTDPAHAAGVQGGADGAESLAALRQRMDGMLELLDTLDELSGKFLDLPHDQLRDTAAMLRSMRTAP